MKSYIPDYKDPIRQNIEKKDIKVGAVLDILYLSLPSIL